MKKKRLTIIYRLLLATLLLSTTQVFAAGAAFHYQLDLNAHLLSDEQGRLTAIEMHWLYDKALSDTLMDGEDLSATKRDSTLKRRAADILEGLQGVQYFTKALKDQHPISFAPVTQYSLALTKESRLQLSMVLPLTQAEALNGHVLQVIVSDASAVGLATFVTRDQLTLSDSLQAQCQAPKLTQSQLGVIDQHTVISETMLIDCR